MRMATEIYNSRRWMKHTGKSLEEYEKMRQRRKNNKIAPSCSMCDKLLIVGQNWCEVDLKHHSYRCRACIKKRSMENDVINRRESICQGCGKSYLARKNQKFCSRRCSANSPEFKATSSRTAKMNIQRDPSKWRAICSIAGKRRQVLYPKLSSETGKITIKITMQKYPDLLSRAGKIGGRKMVESGKIFNIPAPHMTIGACGVSTHKHRSNQEISKCKELQSRYPIKELHSSVRLKRLEIDFVIGQDSNDLSTWEKVIEVHNRCWDKLNKIDDYETYRTKQLKDAGVTCPIEMVLLSPNQHLD